MESMLSNKSSQKGNGDISLIIKNILMPKLLQINICANWGSTGKIAEQIGEVAMSHGWESYIAYGRQVNPSKSNLIKIGTRWDVYRHAIYTLFTDRHGLASQRATKAFIKRIKEMKPDIIHLHNIHGYYINYKILFDYLNSTDIPVVWTLHDCWSFTGHCAYFDSIGCEKWKVDCNICPLKHSYPKSFTDNAKKNLVQKKESMGNLKKLNLIPVSQWLNDFVKKSYLSKNNIRTIHNGVDINKFRPVNHSPSNKFLILGVANIWEKRKGFDDFIQLRAALKDSEYEFILVGLSQEQITKLPTGIQGIKRTNSVEELVELYSKALVYVNLTYEDNFPTTNIEALACGTPVLTYKTGGSPEAISSETGFVIGKGDIDSAVKAIEEIASKGKQYYSANCRHRAIDYFNKNEQFKKYIFLYNEILEIDNK